MKKTLDLKNDKITKLFINYLIPAIAGMLVTSLYIIVDGIFIGQGIGGQGLAAVGIVVPMFTVLSGLGLLFGIGSSTMSAISLARDQKDDANQHFSNAFWLLTGIMIILTVLVLLFQNPILNILGANDAIIGMSKTYLSIMILYSLPYTLAIMLSCFVRVDGAPTYAMLATVGGALLNIIFDYIFIFRLDMGIAGAAYATGIGNTCATLALILFFILKKGNLKFVKPRFHLPQLKGSFSIGFPTFLSQIFISIVTISYNVNFMKLQGETGVSAFSIINYLQPFMLMLFTGVSQAIQPIMSYNYGANQIKRVNETLKLAIKVSVGLGIMAVIIGFTLNTTLATVFISSESAAYEIAKSGIPIFFISNLFIGTTIAIITYFQSIQLAKKATMLSILRGIALVVPLIYILPYIFDITGLWLATVIAEALGTIVASMMLYKSFKSRNTTS